MSFDPQLDARLRDVPLPSGLVERLKSSLAPSDVELDALLRQVAVPAGFLARLRTIPGDELVDQRLCDVPVAFDLVWRARRVSWKTRVKRGVRKVATLAAAALLFLGIGAGMMAGTGALIVSIYRHAVPRGEPAMVVATNAPLEFQSSLEEPGMQFAIVLPRSASEAEPAAAPAADRTVLDVDSPELPSWSPDGPVARWLAALDRGLDPQESFVLMRWPILGYPQFGDERLPALESPQLPRPAGIELPLVRGYDRGFAVRHGVFPPVKPAAHPALANVAVPLSTQSTSYQEIVALLREGRWPSPAQVRTEDFLAAPDYRFPPAGAGELAIRTAGGPSIFGPPGTGLLQIAAVAGPLLGRKSPSTHLVVALDTSASMARGQRLQLVRQAVDRALDHLGPQDRLSLVVFRDEVTNRVERATAAETPGVRQLLAELRPAGGTNLAEGLQHAVAMALSGQELHSDRTRIVLMTDSHVTMPPLTESMVTEMLQAAADDGVEMDVLDVGEQPEVDQTLVKWAELMHGDVRRPQSADQAAWLLIETLYGQSAVVASEAQMTLHWNPHAVAAYRLVGHEANAMAALRPSALAAELRAGEAATALLEIWFEPNDENQVGVVELAWRDPVSGQEHKRTQTISRIQFAPTWEQAPLSLQQGALAAEMAQWLRGSRAALRELGLVPQVKGDLDALLEAAARVHPHLAQRPDFRNWVAFLQQLRKNQPR